MSGSLLLPAEPANITLFDDFGSGVAETDLYNRFERQDKTYLHTYLLYSSLNINVSLSLQLLRFRFDIGGDDDIQVNFTPQEQPQVPSTLVPSPPPRDEKQRAPGTCIHSPPPRQEPPQPQGSSQSSWRLLNGLACKGYQN